VYFPAVAPPLASAENVGSKAGENKPPATTVATVWMARRRFCVLSDSSTVFKFDCNWMTLFSSMRGGGICGPLFNTTKAWIPDADRSR